MNVTKSRDEKCEDANDLTREPEKSAQTTYRLADQRNKKVNHMIGHVSDIRGKLKVECERSIILQLEVTLLNCKDKD